MKAIHTELQIKRVTLNKDDSVSFSAVTPTLSDADLGAFRVVSKVLCNAILEPQIGSTGVLAIKEKIGDGKSPSQRLRSVLFILWEQKGRPQADFEIFYRMKMEDLINVIKNMLK